MIIICILKMFRPHSHRMRKKARNDELLSIEQKYLELKKREERTEARRGCVIEFFAIRTNMLLSALSTTEDRKNDTPSMKDVIENEWLFDVTTLGVRGDSKQGISEMRKLDDSIVGHIKSVREDIAASANVFYQLGKDSLAISGDVAFALAELVHQDTKEVILSLAVHFKFAPGLSKIRSLAWSSPSTPELFNTKPTNGAATAGLNEQAIIPSVVSMHSVASLDHAGSTEGNEEILSQKIGFP